MKPGNFEEWVNLVSSSIKKDSLWQFEVYPKALFLYDLAWEDCKYLLKVVRGQTVSK